VGGSEETAELFGMKVTLLKISVYVISGVLAAAAGVVGRAASALATRTRASATS
jgi:ribose/xylose/arabinose/galactoside ABC-type transport system permease subunit